MERLNLASVLYGVGDLRLEERLVPSPGPGEALVAVKSVGICGSEYAQKRGEGRRT